MAHEKKINGVLYRFEELVGWDAFEALQKLLKIAGPFAPILGAVGITDEAERNTRLAEMLPGIMERHDGVVARELLSALAEGLRADGECAVIGVKPASLDDMFLVFAWMIEAQFSGFFGGAVGSFLSAAAAKS